MDDTPRRDRLVVEYNTSTNPTFEGCAGYFGAGLDGIMHTATYNATEKAIESNGNTGTYNNGPGGSASGNTNDYGSFETFYHLHFREIRYLQFRDGLNKILLRIYNLRG